MKKHELETTINDKTYKGYRIIKTNKAGKFQVIHLTDAIYERDQNIYSNPLEDTVATFAAKDILRSLVRKYLLQ